MSGAASSTAVADRCVGAITVKPECWSDDLDATFRTIWHLRRAENSSLSLVVNDCIAEIICGLFGDADIARQAFIDLKVGLIPDESNNSEKSETEWADWEYRNAACDEQIVTIRQAYLRAIERMKQDYLS